MIKEMVKGEKEKMLERNLYIHNRPSSVWRPRSIGVSSWLMFLKSMQNWNDSSPSSMYFFKGAVYRQSC
jgi:hypothetical protein